MRHPTKYSSSSSCFVCLSLNSSVLHWTRDTTTLSGSLISLVQHCEKLQAQGLPTERSFHAPSLDFNSSRRPTFDGVYTRRLPRTHPCTESRDSLVRIFAGGCCLEQYCDSSPLHTVAHDEPSASMKHNLLVNPSSVCLSRTPPHFLPCHMYTPL